GVGRRAEFLLDRWAERGAHQETAVVPAALVEGARPDAAGAEPFGKSEPMQQPRRVRADVDAGADFTQRLCLLINVHVETGPQQGSGGREAANAAADDRDRAALSHG